VLIKARAKAGTGKGATKSNAMAFGIKWKGVPFDTVNPLIQFRY